MLYSVFLFIQVKLSTNTLELNKITRFKMVINFFDEFVIFQPNFKQKCASESNF